MNWRASSTSPLFVLGMHRSGTSAVSGLVNSMGIPPARWCAESRSNDVNPKGFFEPRPLVWENERILNWLDSSWRFPPSQPNAVDWSVAVKDHGRRSSRVFQRCARTRSQWFWKDPRLCILQPYWELLGITPSDTIVVTRNPADVSRSLFIRNGMDEVESLDLWLTYMLSVVRSCRGKDLFLVDFDDLVDKPQVVCDELASWMRARGWDVAQRQFDESIDPSLRRSARSQPTDVEHPSFELYRELQSFGRGGLVLDQCATIEDRALLTRSQQRRDSAREGWERAQRPDRLGARSVRRRMGILPAAIRELLRERF